MFLEKQKFLQKHWLIIILILIIHCNFSSAIVWLRNTNERGPAAANSGTKCLAELAKFFFYDPTITRTQNVAIMHTNGLSSPAAEILGNFLSLMHRMIATEEITKMQLGIISDHYKIDGMIHMNPSAMIICDYYVLVVDDINKVKFSLYINS